MFRSVLALLMILLAAPAWAASRFGGGFHGSGFHGGGQSGGGIPATGSANQSAARGDGVHDDGFAFHRRVRRARDLFVIYDYGNCGFGFDCGVDDPGYGYGYRGGAGNAVSGSGGGYSGGGYIPDPVGAEIPPVIFPPSCWVRRAGYDPSGAYVGQVLIDLCHRLDGVTVTRVDARARLPNTGKGTGESAPADRSGAPQSPQ
jgi:hypothetical protein